jgi:solute carrier family 50 protein (sugar transporter)
MNNSISITDILGLFGNAFAIVFFIIPSLIIKDLIKTKNTSTIPWLMFLFTILNCEFWMIYGLKIKAWPVYFCNGIGIITNVFYLIIFFLYLESRKIYDRFFMILLLLISISTIFVVFYNFIENKNILGGIACAMNICMFASPLQNIREVYVKEDNSFIPIYASLCLVLNCIIWVSYGCFKGMDYFIIIPNAIGLVLSVFQVYLWIKFRKDIKDKIYVVMKNECGSNGSNEELNIEVNKKIRNNELDDKEIITIEDNFKIREN